MLFILDDNKPYWPDTAIMKRRDLRTASFNKKKIITYTRRNSQLFLLFAYNQHFTFIG